MSDYKTPIPIFQGSTKLSEISMDTETSLFQSPVHDSALRVVEKLTSTIKDLLRRQSFFLRSEGVIKWDGSKINLDNNEISNNIILDILQTENASQPKISIKIFGNIVDSTETTFKSISLDDGELLYLELDPEIVLSSTQITVENAIDGGSLISGKTLRKVALTAGMPTAVNPVDGPATTTTYYIPLAYRSGSDIYWIPHGIVWPAGSLSALGAVLPTNLQPYPEKFVNNVQDLQNSLTDLSSAGGGVLLLTDSFSISSPISVPANVKILGRGKKTVLTLTNSGSFTLGENSQLDSFQIKVHSNFSGNAIHMNGGKRAKLKNMVIDLSSAADQPQVGSFNYNAVDNTKFNDFILDIATQSDGKILISGFFTNYGGIAGRNYLVRLNSDGTVDADFCANAVDGSKFNANIKTIALDSFENIYLGGAFTNYLSYGNNHVVKLTPSGNLETTFMNNAVTGKITGWTYTYFSGFSMKTATVYVQLEKIIIDFNNNVYISGRFKHLGSDSGVRYYLIKSNSSGIIDATYCYNLDSKIPTNSTILTVSSLALNGASLYFGGNFLSYGGISGRNRLIKLNTDGTVDATFCSNAVDGSKFNDGQVNLIVVQSNGGILVGGSFNSYGSVSGRHYLIRLNPGGIIDTDFCVNAVDGDKFSGGAINAIATQSDGKTLVGGDFTSYGGTSERSRLVRLNSDGTLDTAFCANAVDGNKFNYAIRAISTLSDSKILVGGIFSNYAVLNRNRLVKLNSDGIIDPTILIYAINVCGIRMEADHCKIYKSWIIGTTSAVQKIGINYVAGYNNVNDIDTLFE